MKKFALLDANESLLSIIAIFHSESFAVTKRCAISLTTRSKIKRHSRSFFDRNEIDVTEQERVKIKSVGCVRKPPVKYRTTFKRLTSIMHASSFRISILMCVFVYLFYSFFLSSSIFVCAISLCFRLHIVRVEHRLIITG